MRRLAASLVMLWVLTAGLALAAPADVKIDQLFDRALAQLRHEQMDEALSTAREAVLLAPASAEAWMIVGIVRQEREDDELAVAAFRKAIRLAPTRPMPWVNLAWTYNLMGDGKQMEQAAQMAVQLGPDLPVAWRHLATAQWSLGKQDDAVRSFRHALRLDPHNGRYRAFLGGLLSEMGRSEEAFAEYDAGLRDLGIYMAEAYVSLSWAAQDVGDVARSTAAAEQAVKVATRDLTRASAYNVLAYARMYAGDLPAATAAVEEAMKLAPTESDYQDTAGVLALLRDDLPAAEKYLTAAMAQKRAEHEVNPTAALLWAKQGKREQALAQLAALERQIAETGGVIDDYYLAAQAYATLGEKAEARRMFLRALEKSPKNPWSVQINQWLEAND